MRFLDTIRSRRSEDSEIHWLLMRAAAWWLPRSSEMRRRELVRRWTDTARDFAEGVER